MRGRAEIAVGLLDYRSFFLFAGEAAIDADGH
jgi:hypothetical protein